MERYLTWYVAGEWILKLAMIPVIAHRRRLTSALSWLTIIFFLPWLGALLYLVFADHRVTRRMKIHRRKLDEIRAGGHLAFQDNYAVTLLDGQKHRALSRLSDRLGGFRTVGGNEIDLLEDFSKTLAHILDDIRHAQENVHLLFYIIDHGPVGETVADALIEATTRGVRCRVLADAIGSRRFLRKIAPRLRSGGVEVRKLLPIPKLLRRLRPIDLRNHRKLAVIDGRVAYAGSMNLSNAFRSSGSEPLPWRDVTFRLRGPAVLQLQEVFREDWAYNGGRPLERSAFPPPRQEGGVPLQVVPSGPPARLETLHHMLVAAINGAESRILLTTPYLIPDEPTRVALRLAALRGVDVDVVVPYKGDSLISTLANHGFFQELLEDGIRIHIHRRGFLHSKTLTVDGAFSVVGSANFDRRSFHLNFELNLLIYGEDAVQQVVDLQTCYLNEATPVDPEQWARRGLGRELSENVARLLSPVL